MPAKKTNVPQAKLPVVKSSLSEQAFGMLEEMIVTLQLPANSSDATLAGMAAARYGVDERDLRELLTASAAAGHESELPADRALGLVRRMQAIVRKTVE